MGSTKEIDPSKGCKVRPRCKLLSLKGSKVCKVRNRDATEAPFDRFDGRGVRKILTGPSVQLLLLIKLDHSYFAASAAIYHIHTSVFLDAELDTVKGLVEPEVLSEFFLIMELHSYLRLPGPYGRPRWRCQSISIHSTV